MTRERDAADDLLERARRLQERTEEASPPGRDPRSQRRPERRPEDPGWLQRAAQAVRRFFGRVRRVLSLIVRFSGPLKPVLRFIGERIRRFSLFVSCNRDETGVRTLSAFSPKRLLKSVAVAFSLYVLMLAFYVYGTRREGVFMINNFHLVDGESDVYQAGGCMKHSSIQTACEEGDAEIVLIRPSWIPGMGLNPLDYDEEVGQIPIQGECYVGMYGWYLRGPSLTRGLLKPVAFRVDNCRAAFPGTP